MNMYLTVIHQQEHVLLTLFLPFCSLLPNMSKQESYQEQDSILPSRSFTSFSYKVELCLYISGVIKVNTVSLYQETLLVGEFFLVLIFTLRILAGAYCQDLKQKHSYGSKANISFFFYHFCLFLAMDSATL